MIKKTIILVAAVAALGVSASPASASCTSDPTVPTCVNYAIDTAEWAVQTALDAYNNVVQPEVNKAACLVVHIVSNEDC